MNIRIFAFGMAMVIVLMAFAGIVSLVSAKGPTNAGGIKPVEEYDVPFAPYNDDAWWHSGQWISPYTTGPPLYLPDMGTTVIVEDDVTITVSEIPEATYNTETGEWEGTHLMWKANYNAKEYSFSIKFWLNGAGPVIITYDYGNANIVTEEANEFIFFKSGYVDGSWETSLQTYR